MVSIRAQSAAAVSRQNSSQDDNSSDETQSISSQNSLAGENLNLIPEGDQISLQDLLSQNSSITSLIRSIFDQTEDTMSIISVLVKAGEISSLNESADWSEWNRKLKNYLSMIELWKILTEDSSEPTDSEKHLAWSEKQKQLERLLDLILGTSARSLIERITGKNATQQYKILENEYNKISISTFSQMYRRVFRCSLFNHKSVQEYDDEIINARNKLIELRRSIDELAVTCAFLNGLDGSYQGWKNMWINNQDIYIKKNRKDLNVLKIEEILIKLVNREASRKSTSKNEQSQKNKAFAAKKRDQSADDKSDDDDDKDKKRCFNCNSPNHSAKDCWYVYSEKANDKFRVKYLTEESRKSAMNDMKKTQKEWTEKDDKNDFKKRILSVRVILTAEEKKDDQWYLNSAAVVHVTHDLRLFISDLNEDVIECIETASDEQIETRGSGTIEIEMTVDDKNITVTMTDVHYCLELNSNLISLDVLKAKKFDFLDRKDWLTVIDEDDDVVLQAKRQNNVYSLLQSRHFDCSNSWDKVLIVKNLPLDVWHQRVDHMNFKDLIILSKVTKRVEFAKSQKDEKDDHFCETCVLGKAHKIHSKTPAAHRAKMPDERLHSDLFDDESTLSDVEGYRYGVIVMNDHTRMKFFLILKSKDEITIKIQALFNKMKTHTDRKIRFFRIDDDREFAPLKETLNDKDIEWEKSAFFAQDQDDVSERTIRTVIEKARTLLIAANLSKRLWPETLTTACYLSNRSSIKALDGKTSYEAWYDEKPDLSNLRMYDCKAYVIDYHAKEKDKMTKRAWTDTLVGYEVKNQWRIYDGKSVFIRRDVMFNEAKMTYKNSVEKSELLLDSLYLGYEDDDHFNQLEMTMKMIIQWESEKILTQKIQKIPITKKKI